MSGSKFTRTYGQIKVDLGILLVHATIRILIIRVYVYSELWEVATPEKLKGLKGEREGNWLTGQSTCVKI